MASIMASPLSDGKVISPHICWRESGKHEKASGKVVRGGGGLGSMICVEGKVPTMVTPGYGNVC